MQDSVLVALSCMSRDGNLTDRRSALIKAHTTVLCDDVLLALPCVSREGFSAETCTLVKANFKITSDAVLLQIHFLFGIHNFSEES